MMGIECNANGRIETQRLADIESLTRSASRFRVLTLLCDAPRSRTGLRESLDIHRTTLRDHLVTLEQANRIEKLSTGNAYRALPSGRILVRSIHETMAAFRTADRLGELLTRLPTTPRANTPQYRRCEITPCESDDPYAPVERFATLIGEAERFRGFVPACNPMYVEPFGARIDAGHDFELIGPGHVFEAIRSRYPQTLSTALNAVSTQLLVVEDMPRFGAALLDDTAVIAAYDEDMRTHSLLETGSQQHELVEWVKKQYATQREAAIPYEEYAENS